MGLTWFWCCSVQVSQVEVYPGSGVLCDIRSWQAANQTQSPTAMARTLLMGVFDMTTLMNSNLRGGRSRRPAFQPQRSALDPHKINAIFSEFSRCLHALFLSEIRLNMRCSSVVTFLLWFLRCHLGSVSSCQKRSHWLWNQLQTVRDSIPLSKSQQRPQISLMDSWVIPPPRNTIC